MVNPPPSERFHPLLRHHLVNTLGWRALRPLQERAAEPILGGAHLLVLAPTAGGKTEAAVLPVLSRLLTEGWAGTSILYLCPLKALLNNLHPRLGVYFGMVGHRVCLWHGDTAPGERRRIESEPPACLMTTPESLEVMLISSRQGPRTLLKDVRVVIVDEIHAFAGDDRGIHLRAVVERISALAGRELQRIGLSATVGNPEGLLDWLAGHCAGRKGVVAESGGTAQADVLLDYTGNLENAALVISRLHRGRKRLVFCDSRRRVEELAVHLKAQGVSAFVSHSSLSLERRREAERAFAEGENCVIVATSTLELGIDVGDLDRVIQIDAPATVASFLQRLGRTGRREGTVRNCLFLATNPAALLHAAALISLWEEGFVEPIYSPREPFHLFAQQLLALSLQHRGLARDGWQPGIGRLPVFREMGNEEREAILGHLIRTGILGFDGVWLAMGEEGEKRFGRRHFLELMSVFTSSPDFEVLHGNHPIGTLDWLALASNDGSRRHPVILAGRSWDLLEIDWKKRRVFVTPSEGRGKVRWRGVRRGLTFVIAQRIRQLVLASGESTRWSARAKTEMANQKEQFHQVAGEAGRIYHDAAESRIRWSTFAGNALNEILGSVLERELKQELAWDDFEISFPASTDVTAIRTTVEELLGAPNLIERLPGSQELLDQLKFSACLPPALAKRAVYGRAELRGLAQAFGIPHDCAEEIRAQSKTDS
ncbi:MAG: DEAD/DEAH box helicase [Verrucomicrobia bacterium]|nr:DEAD/DEAH box helicase [Verrucomicrobiota bacterium]